MSKAKLLVEKKNSSGVATVASGGRFPAKIITAHVKNDGDRAVDSAEFLIPMSSEVNEGDTVRYIQDDVETDSLIGLWNFNGSSRDESGYDNDGNDGTHTAQMNREDSVTTEEYTKDNKVGADFQNGTDVITIPNKTHLVTDSPNVLNFSGLFDFFLRFRYSDGVDTKQIVFSKRSSTTGIEIGYDASHHVIVEITSSSSTTTITGTTSVENTMHLIRVRRNAAGLVQLFINGTEEGTAITNTTDLTVTGNGFFGADYLGNNDTNDLFLTMIRIYKDNLSDADADILLNHFRHAFTMKFEGTVWKIEDKVKNKRIHCKGINRLLPETVVNKRILESRDESATSNGIDNIFTGLGTSEVMQQMLDQIDSEYLVVDHDNSPNTLGNFIAYGNLLANIQIMLLVNNNQFYTLPRKVIMIDPINTTSNYIFVHGKGYEISSSGADDSTVLNDITLKSGDAFRTIRETPSETGIRNYVLTKEPASITRVLDGTTVINYVASGSGSPSYTFDAFSKTINLNSAASGTVSIEYTYADSDLYLAPYRDPASIAKYGLKSKQISPMGVQGSSNLGLLQAHFRDDNKEANERITIRAPLLLNSIRINHEIQVKNDILGINITTGQSNPSIQIKSIEWFYPEGRTIINAGEHKFDSFDIDKFTAAQVRQVTEDSDITKTV